MTIELGALPVRRVACQWRTPCQTRLRPAQRRARLHPGFLLRTSLSSIPLTYSLPKTALGESRSKAGSSNLIFFRPTHPLCTHFARILLRRASILYCFLSWLRPQHITRSNRSVGFYLTRA